MTGVLSEGTEITGFQTRTVDAWVFEHCGLTVIALTRGAIPQTCPCCGTPVELTKAKASAKVRFVKEKDIPRLPIDVSRWRELGYGFVECPMSGTKQSHTRCHEFAPGEKPGDRAIHCPHFYGRIGAEIQCDYKGETSDEAQP